MSKIYMYVLLLFSISAKEFLCLSLENLVMYITRLELEFFNI